MVSGIVHPQVEVDKRDRRAVANSNERRRMKSINAGFDSLRHLLPPSQDGEKMSKSTILQLTAKYIQSLLNRISVLEGEVSHLQQQQHHQSPSASDFEQDLGLSRKRKLSEKRNESFVSRNKKKMDDIMLFQQNIEPLSPVSHGSPRSESDSSTVARLEHLIMAIDKIEGGLNGQISPPLNDDDAFFSSSNGSANPSAATIAAAVLKPSISPYTDETMFANTNVIPSTEVADYSDESGSNTTTTATLLVTSSSSSTAAACRSSSNLPIVTKLLSSRSTPHKFVHRPVLLNSSQ